MPGILLLQSPRVRYRSGIY